MHRLFQAYARSLPFSLEFQGFADEMASLPVPYAGPRGCLLLALQKESAVGVVALKSLSGETAEIKRLYVDPAARGKGLGRRLAERAIAAARCKRYQQVRLDTHRPSMAAAMTLYRQLGFVEIAPYGPNPGGMFGFFEKRLDTFAIRQAQPADAASACDVLRRSIIELCGADHHDDPESLADWLRNKTPEIVGRWIASPSNTMLLAVDGRLVLAVGAVTDAGEITLNYVAPEARFRGISKAMVAALEARAAALGNRRCTLTSTKTAEAFYASAGYLHNGPMTSKFAGTTSHPMVKQLREER